MFPILVVQFYFFLEQKTLKFKTAITHTSQSCANAITNVSEQHWDNNIWCAQLRQVTADRHDLNDGLATQILLQILSHQMRHGHVLLTLQNVARDGDHRKYMSHVIWENYVGYAQGYIRPHVEEGTAEFLHCHWVHVATHY